MKCQDGTGGSAGENESRQVDSFSTWGERVSTLSKAHKASKVLRTLLRALPDLAEVVDKLVAHRNGEDLAGQLDTESSRLTKRAKKAKIEGI